MRPWFLRLAILELIVRKILVDEMFLNTKVTAREAEVNHSPRTPTEPAAIFNVC